MILDFLFRNSSSGHNKILTTEDLAAYLSKGASSGAGVNVTPDRAMRYAAVFACVRVLAESVGQLPLHLYQTKGERERVKATDHPLYLVLYSAPNAYQTAQEWREWIVACLALRGNAYCQIIRVRDQVVELLPIMPGVVTPKQDPRSRVVTYDITETGGGTVTLPASDVLHLKLFSLDGLMGLSPIGYAREAIGLGIATEEHGAGLFSRGAAPGGVLQSDQVLTPEVAARLKATWAERHEGSGNSHRVAVLEQGLKWQAVGMSSEDAQFLETRKYQRSEVAGLFRVPPHLIGDLERATFTNIEQQGLDFITGGLMPYLTRIEQRVAFQLLSAKQRAEYFAKFNVGGLVRGDMAARGAFYTNQVQNGAMSPNEIRELEDRNPREGGDVFLQPSNMVVSGTASPDPAPKK